MNKICTSLEQSQKLIELGIDINTADMYYEKDTTYPKILTKYEITYANVLYGSYDIRYFNIFENTPAWSLSALVKILSDITDYSFELVFLKRTTDGRGDVLENIYRCSVDMKDTWNTEPIDAIFEMIVWLKENNKL